MNVVVEGVSIEIEGIPIVTDVDITVASGSFHGLIGPNGSGKSTVLRAIYRSLRPVRGVVLLEGDDLWGALNARQAARRRAVVTQDSVFDLEFTVRDVVAMGRTPHKGAFSRDDERDRQVVDRALRDVEMTWAEARSVATLSGGERQRVLLGRALAQEAPVLVLDEPTNHLDVRAQHELLDLVRSLGLTTIAALHDLDHAASVCDRITVLDQGRVAATGAPTEVLVPELIREVFGVAAHVGRHPLTGRLHVVTASLPSSDEKES